MMRVSPAHIPLYVKLYFVLSPRYNTQGSYLFKLHVYWIYIYIVHFFFCVIFTAAVFYYYFIFLLLNITIQMLVISPCRTTIVQPSIVPNCCWCLHFWQSVRSTQVQCKILNLGFLSSDDNGQGRKYTITDFFSQANRLFLWVAQSFFVFAATTYTFLSFVTQNTSSAKISVGISITDGDQKNLYMYTLFKDYINIFAQQRTTVIRSPYTHFLTSTTREGQEGYIWYLMTDRPTIEEVSSQPRLIVVSLFVLFAMDDQREIKFTYAKKENNKQRGQCMVMI